MSVQQAKIDYIVETSAQLFLDKGISSVTIKDVAAKVGVGEATLYRYFANKQNLVVAVATRMAADVRDHFFDLSAPKAGLDKLRAFYGDFLTVYRERPDYFRFISKFDATVTPNSGLDEYENTLLPYFEDYLAAYRLGREDGTVKEIEDVKLFYLATTHALMGLCKKLTLNRVILNQDSRGEQEVQALIDVFVYRLNNLRV